MTRHNTYLEKTYPTDGKCPICVEDVPSTGFHAYPGVFKFIDHNYQRSIDREILAELKEIRRFLEVAIDENFHVVQNDR